MTVSAWIVGRRGLGCNADRVDPRDHDAVTRYGLDRVPLPISVSLRRYLRTVLNQGPTQSCVVHVVAHALMIRDGQRPGSDLSLTPSRLFLYYHARRFDGDVRPMLDRGTTIRSAAAALRHLGVSDDDHWPWSVLPWRVASQPTWAAYMDAHARQGGAYARILAPLGDRGASVRAALAAGFPIILGTLVTRSFLPDAGPGIIDRPIISDPIAGRHALTVTGYHPHPLHGYTYEVVNSWGADWRLGGSASLTEAYLTWDQTSDLTVVEGWPAMVP